MEMNAYYSTFPSGFQELVKDLLKQKDEKVRLLEVLDGAVYYESCLVIEQIRKISFFQNSFLVLNAYSRQSDENWESWIRKRIISNRIHPLLRDGGPLKRHGTFRIVVSHTGKLQKHDESTITLLEEWIKKTYPLKINRTKAHYEFWLLTRSEDPGFFLLRLTKRKKTEKQLQKGELKPEVANLICLLSEPRSDDVFLDPFCGFGSIPFERAELCGYRMIFACDRDENMVDNLKKLMKIRLTKKQKKTFFPKCLSVDKLSSFQDGFITRIVTDPPWGQYEPLSQDIKEFYHLLLSELSRVLKREGIFVLLAHRDTDIQGIISEKKLPLSLMNEFHILISGKKATAYKLRKI
ncbi:MAG: hypothetical protein JW969_02435 [Spirochaetales bacterium]|nr:hypothetical protein [Spirochaetales bacterium]